MAQGILDTGLEQHSGVNNKNDQRCSAMASAILSTLISCCLIASLRLYLSLSDVTLVSEVGRGIVAGRASAKSEDPALTDCVGVGLGTVRSLMDGAEVGAAPYAVRRCNKS